MAKNDIFGKFPSSSPGCCPDYIKKQAVNWQVNPYESLNFLTFSIEMHWNEDTFKKTQNYIKFFSFCFKFPIDHYNHFYLNYVT